MRQTLLSMKSLTQPTSYFVFHISYLLLIALALFSCHRGEKDRLLMGSLPETNSGQSGGGGGGPVLGTLTLGTGKIFSASAPTQVMLAPGYITEGIVHFQAIDISTDGSNWISLLSSPTSVTVYNYANRQTVSAVINPVNIPAAEYHGVRVRFSNPAVTVIGTDTGEIPTNLDAYPQIYLWSNKVLPSSQEVMFSSENGELIPFRVEVGQNTWLILDMYHSSLSLADPSYWQLQIGARATRFSQS